MSGSEGHRLGRARSTDAATLGSIGLQLFIERGFDEVTVDDIAAAAGIGRRTFFRYFPSKNDLPWGDFDALLAMMREYLAAVPPEIPLFDALHDAVIEFNRFPDEERESHRRRMEVLLRTPTLVAHSALRYQAWRQVIAEFVGRRLGVPPTALQPQTIGWACLGISLAAYDEWLAHEDHVLTVLIDQGFTDIRAVFSPANAH
ncbi:mycofactocin system transcriptional regulator [Georgenia halophila]|uniref:mycofactocin system transcriptional regulator n=1 Tax=Georgenia halophila TaxID=620889 RepID=UPI0031F12736